MQNTFNYPLIKVSLSKVHSKCLTNLKRGNNKNKNLKSVFIINFNFRKKLNLTHLTICTDIRRGKHNLNLTWCVCLIHSYFHWNSLNAIRMNNLCKIECTYMRHTLYLSNMQFSITSVLRLDIRIWVHLSERDLQRDYSDVTCASVELYRKSFT